MIFIFLTLLLLSIIHIFLIDRRNTDSLKKTALVWSFLFLSVFSVITFLIDSNYNFQYTEDLFWISFINVAMDGISLVFINLSLILVITCLLVTWEINRLVKEYILMIFITLFLLVLVFITLDLLVFYILFECTLIPMFLLIGVWGSREEKVKAAFYFFFYTLIGSFLMLLTIFKLYSITGSTDYQFLLSVEIPKELQCWFFIGFMVSLGVKIPMVPVHIWLPQAHVEAPLSGSILLAGILLKLGGYGIIRFVFPLFPVAAEYFSPLILTLSLVAIIHGALMACRQSDMKRLIAYSSVSHMGFVTLALFTHSLEGLIGSIIMMIAHGLVSSGMFMFSGVIYLRHHTRVIKYYKGLTLTMPLLSSISFILTISNIGFPMTLNFIAELLSILSAINYSFTLGLISFIGVFICTVYSLYFYSRIFFGTLNSYLKNSRDLELNEFLAFSPLIFFTIFLGLYPSIITSIILKASLINISL